MLEPIVKQATSTADLTRKLGLKPSGGNHRIFRALIRFFNLDDSHFTGQNWSKGKTARDHSSIEMWAFKNSTPHELVFCENSSYHNNSSLGFKLVKMGWEYKCNLCHINEWQNKILTLHIDHINGINNDHRLENLQFLCPNCHQQTDTWGNKKGLKSSMTASAKWLKMTTPPKPKSVYSPKPRKKQTKSRATKRPPVEVLRDLIWTIPSTEIATRYNVSSKAVEKWCKIYGLSKPPRGYWAKLRAGNI